MPHCMMLSELYEQSGGCGCGAEFTHSTLTPNSIDHWFENCEAPPPATPRFGSYFPYNDDTSPAGSGLPAMSLSVLPKFAALSILCLGTNSAERSEPVDSHHVQALAASGVHVARENAPAPPHHRDLSIAPTNVHVPFTATVTDITGASLTGVNVEWSPGRDLVRNSSTSDAVLDEAAINTVGARERRQSSLCNRLTNWPLATGTRSVGFGYRCSTSSRYYQNNAVRRRRNVRSTSSRCAAYARLSSTSSAGQDCNWFCGQLRVSSTPLRCIGAYDQHYTDATPISQCSAITPESCSLNAIDLICVCYLPSTRSPTRRPTRVPTRRPTRIPTRRPTRIPTRRPTRRPTTRSPTRVPTRSPTNPPTRTPTTRTPTAPTASPSAEPTAIPTIMPTAVPTAMPTLAPSANPTTEPTTATPTLVPTAIPTAIPTLAPSANPTAEPTTATPTTAPTAFPTARPTLTPTAAPTAVPTAPTTPPTAVPTGTPTPPTAPTTPPTAVPTGTPTSSPTAVAASSSSSVAPGSGSDAAVIGGICAAILLCIVVAVIVGRRKQQERQALESAYYVAGMNVNPAFSMNSAPDPTKCAALPEYETVHEESTDEYLHVSSGQRPSPNDSPAGIPPEYGSLSSTVYVVPLEISASSPGLNGQQYATLRRNDNAPRTDDESTRDDTTEDVPSTEYVHVSASGQVCDSSNYATPSATEYDSRRSSIYSIPLDIPASPTRLDAERRATLRRNDDIPSRNHGYSTIDEPGGYSTVDEVPSTEYVHVSASGQVRDPSNYATPADASAEGQVPSASEYSSRRWSVYSAPLDIPGSLDAERRATLRKSGDTLSRIDGYSTIDETEGYSTVDEMVGGVPSTEFVYVSSSGQLCDPSNYATALGQGQVPSASDHGSRSGTVYMVPLEIPASGAQYSALRRDGDTPSRTEGYSSLAREGELPKYGTLKQGSGGQVAQERGYSSLDSRGAAASSSLPLDVEGSNA